MPKIRLPDASERQFDKPVNGLQIASEISKGLVREAVAVRVDGELWDLKRSIEDDVSIEIVKRDSDDGLELLRHDAAHVLAEAVKELWPAQQVTIGPAIENGFYYDFARDEPFTPEDLVLIEARMKEIVDRDEPIEREVWERAAAIRFFRDQYQDCWQLLQIAQRRQVGGFGLLGPTSLEVFFALLLAYLFVTV